jgi:ATP-dependent Lon protease
LSEKVRRGRSSEEPAASGVFEEEHLPEVLPVLPLRNTVIFPALVTPMIATTPRAQLVVEQALEGDRLLAAVAARDSEIETPQPKDLYDVATAIRILRVVKRSDGSQRLWVQGVRRVELVEYLETEPALRARVVPIVDRVTPSLELEALHRHVSTQFLKVSEEKGDVREPVRALVSGVEDSSVLADVVAANLGLSVELRQQLLAEPDVEKRLERISEHLAREHEVSRLEEEIRTQVQEELSRSQREYVLREQARAIRRQLGEAADTAEQVDLLRERLEARALPEEVREQAERELHRLAALPPGAMEAGTIRTYLEWILDLPWDRETKDVLEVGHARRILEEDHYDLEKVKERILEFIAVLRLKKDLRGPILCFVGPPGTGKTSLGRSIARALGREFARISLGGVRDEAEIRGHRRTYVGSLPGRILQTLRRAGTRNPVIMLDEIDKLGVDFRGDPASALLEVLDPEQNANFSDHYLELRFDLSKVLFIATANTLDTIPPALLDRMEVIEVPGYAPEDKLEIARLYLWPRQIERHGLGGREPALPPETITALIDGYTREAGLRNLERELGKVARKVARRLVEKGEAPAKLEPGDLVEWLGPVRFEAEVAGRVQIPGVAVGLAVSGAGGEVLFIEATRMPGKGRVQITGSLGDVMRESAQTAIALVRSRAKELGLDPGLFAKSDFHIHVPSGGTPKDGPSAGVAILTALASLLTDRPVPSDLAMTGEITLRGRVLPVGGVKEKVLAAKRGGLTRVLLPARNRKDLADVPEPRLADLDILGVETIDEVLRATFPAQAIA